MLPLACFRESPSSPSESTGDSSIVLSKPFIDNQGNIIENGHTYDWTEMNILHYKTLVLPQDAVVRRNGKQGWLRIYMKKVLSCASHGKPITIHDARQSMGCVMKVNGETLSVATFGEFFHKEGGTRMEVVFVAPPNIAVQKKAGLSGDHSSQERLEQTQTPRGFAARRCLDAYPRRP